MHICAQSWLTHRYQLYLTNCALCTTGCHVCQLSVPSGGSFAHRARWYHHMPAGINHRQMFSRAARGAHVRIIMLCLNAVDRELPGSVPACILSLASFAAAADWCESSSYVQCPMSRFMSFLNAKSQGTAWPMGLLSAGCVER